MNEAELVFTQVLNCDKLSLYLNKEINLDSEQSLRVGKILSRRILGEPLQYILGSSEFMGFRLKTDKRALIPRPETEILVEAVIEEARILNRKPFEVFDLGTGCGCIAIAIAKLLPEAIVWAGDISEQAIDLAKENADLNNGRVKIIKGDLFKGLEVAKKFDLIVSNPPYISSSSLNSLPYEISFEPRLALKAGADGLDFYRRIVKEAVFYLKPEGWLAFEVGINQANKVKQICSKDFGDIKILNDYNNIERIVIAKRRKL